MTDTDALQRYARRRDPAAFAHLVESYQPMVYAVCLRRLRHEADARDATQDTFVKLARSASDIGSQGGSVVGWLHRCATTTSIDLIRRETRRRGREREAASTRPESTPSIDPAWDDIRTALDDALDELSDAQRELLVQRFLVGQTQARLAEQAEVSPSMMSRRVSSALEALRERLNHKGFAVGLAALTAGLSAEAAVAVPAGLAATLHTTALSSTGTAATSATSSSLTSGGGWLWLGTRIKLSTAILGSLGVHAALVATVLWLGPGLTTVVTPPASQPVPQPTGSPSAPSFSPSQVAPTSPATPAVPRSADQPNVIRVADADAGIGFTDLDNQDSTVEEVFPTESETRGRLELRPASFEATDSDALVFSPDGDDRTVYVSPNAIAAGHDFVGATTTVDHLGRPALSVQLSESAAQRLAEHTRQNINQPIAVILDGQPVSAPTIWGEISETVLLMGEGDLFEAMIEQILQTFGEEKLPAESNPDPEPYVINPEQTGEWLLRLEDRQGNPAPDDVAPGLRGARLRFAGDEVTFTFTYGGGPGRLRYRVLADEPRLPGARPVGILLEAPDASWFNNRIGQRIPVMFGALEVRGDRAYTVTNVLNPETNVIERVAPGDYDPRGYRTFLIRPEAEAAVHDPIAENLLKNSSFEQGQDEPLAWSTGAAVPGVTYRWDRQQGKQGEASLMLKKDVDRFFPIAQWFQIVPHDADQQRLQVSAQVKARDITKAIIDVVFLDERGEWIKHEWVSYIGRTEPGGPPVSHDWKRYENQLEIPEGTSQIQVGLQIYGPGQVWFDQVEAVYLLNADEP